MAKGDTITVMVRTPVGTETLTVTASRVGSKLDLQEPRGQELYLAIEEQNRNGGKISRHLFAKGEVLTVTDNRTAE